MTKLRSSICGIGRLTDPIKVWAGTSTIVDGHNRFAICQEFGFQFPGAVEELEFDSRDDVKRWILENQLGRRNLELMDRARYTAMLVSSSSEPKPEAVKKIAKEQEKSPRTVYRDLEVNDLLNDLPFKVRSRIEKGDIDVTAASLRAMNTLPPDQRMQACDLIEHSTGDPATSSVTSVADAVRLVRKHAVPGDDRKPATVIDAERFIDKFIEQAPKLLEVKAEFHSAIDSDHLEQCKAALNVFAKHWRDWSKETE